MTEQPQEGQVVTFYSYKGGTGRSMALANIACLMARQNQGDILMVDWDLEAPGLHRYFPTPAAHVDGKSSTLPGLIDLMLELDKATPKSQPSAHTDLDALAEESLKTVDLSAYITETEVSGLHLLKAGRFDSAYATRVNTFNWEGLHQRSPRLMPMLAQKLAQTYRQVLLDARTGISDISGICTTLLPEILVVVFTPNQQSLTGVEEMVRRATDYRRRSGDARPLLVYPLPSRIDPEREQLRTLWRHGDASQGIEGYQPMFENLLGAVYALQPCKLNDYFKEVFIPHSPDFAYGEAVAVLREKDDDRYSLSRNYQAFMQWFDGAVSPWDSPAEIRRETALRKNAEEIAAAALSATPDFDSLLKRAALLLAPAPLPAAAFETVARAILALAKACFGQQRASVSELIRQYFIETQFLPEIETARYAGQIMTAGTLCQESGDYRTAVQLFERAQARLDAVDAGGNLMYLKATNKLSEALRSQGDLIGARDQAEQGMQRSAAFFSADHPDALTSMTNLAATLGALGDLADARALFEKVLATRRRTLGEEHPDTLAGMDNLAGTLWYQGDQARARALFEQTLAARRRILGEEHPDTLVSINNLADTLRDQGDLAGARALFERVLATRYHTLGTEHPDTLWNMNKLARTIRAQGDLAGARALFEQVLETRRRILGEEHPDTLSSMNNLANTLRDQGELASARALFEKILEICPRILGPENPATLTSMHNLASTLSRQGDLTSARALFEQVLETRRRVLGEEHPDTLTSMNNLADTLLHQGDQAGARVLLERALEVQHRILGEEHPGILATTHNLASTLSDQGDLAGARALQEKVLEARRRILGEEHPDTLATTHNLSVTLRAQGEVIKARAAFEKALEARRRILGEEHPDTLATMNSLATLLYEMGEIEPAYRLMSAAAAANAVKQTTQTAARPFDL